MQGPLQGLFSNLQDCPLTVSSQLHKPGWRGREGVKEGLQNAIYQVKQHLTRLTTS